VWRSLVAHLLWEQGAGGSNPLTPTILPLRSRTAPLRRAALRAPFFSVLTLALALGACGTTLQTVFDPVVLKVERSTKYYDVRGANSTEIFDYLAAHSEMDARGRRLVGSTASSARLEWSALPGTTSCYLQRMIIRLNLVVTLPRHEHADGLQAEDRANWDRLVAHIAEHEQRHVDIELEFAGKLQSQIRVLPTASSCPELTTALNQVSKSVQAEAGRAHRRFHLEDATRREAERRPIQALIDADRAKLALVESEIWGLDRILADIGRRRDGLVTVDQALDREESDAVERKAKLQEESRELQRSIDSLSEKYKFTW
jgi:predicted secreted Zn-dependent protease